MEIEPVDVSKVCIFPDQGVDRIEAKAIEALKSSCGVPYPDKTEWLTEPGRKRQPAAYHRRCHAKLGPPVPPYGLSICFLLVVPSSSSRPRLSRSDMSRFRMDNRAGFTPPG